MKTINYFYEQPSFNTKKQKQGEKGEDVIGGAWSVGQAWWAEQSRSLVVCWKLGGGGGGNVSCFGRGLLGWAVALLV